MNDFIDCPMEDGTTKRMKLIRLTEKYIPETAEICDRCVGKNLYSEAYLKCILHNPGHFFYLLLSDGDAIAGYMYFIMMNREELAGISKLEADQLDQFCGKTDIVIGNLRSIGVDEKFRNKGLSVKLIQFSLEQLAFLGARIAVALCWKAGRQVPMKKTMLACGMQYVTDAHRVWYDIEDLECPYCGGRCKCDAEVYYRQLEDKQ